jgi:PII-like signaling protein
MHGSLLRLYAHEDQRHHGKPLWAWLLAQGNRLGLQGGTAFKAMAGFGRHPALHEARFFEFVSALAVQVEFIATAQHAQQRPALLH